MSGGNNNVVLPQNPAQPSSSLSPIPTGAASTASGTKVSTLSEVQNIVSSSLAAEKPATTALLALPNVPDSEIVISPSGVSTAISYLAYFGANLKNINFNDEEFGNVLKGKNGVLLSVPGLIEKAIADNNFPEVANSLTIQQKFIKAEVIFLESIPVSGNAVAINKENIGLEELSSGLVDKALAVAAGSLSRNDFISYDNQFNATAEAARQGFVAQSGVLSLNKTPSFFDRILAALGIGTAAKAQSADAPFGGMVTVLEPCPCSLGTVVYVGPPVPADLFVPDAFLLTPLFFADKTMSIGAWWLGLYDDISPPIPCLVPSGAACIPIDLGQEVIMTGTS